MEDEQLLDKVLGELKDQKDFSRNIGICGASEDAQSIIALDESVSGSIGIYIRDMVENNFKTLDYPVTTLGDLFVARSQAKSELELSMLIETNELPVFDGLQSIKVGNTP